MKPVGYGQITALAGPKGLISASIPDTATLALVQAENHDVRWRDDGTDPTATVGMILAEGDILQVERESLHKIRFIQTAAGSKLNVSFFKQ